MLNLRNGQLSGNLAGRAVLGTLQRSAGSPPAPGVYRLLPPVNDPIYGVVITALPRYSLVNTTISSVHQSGGPSGSFVISGKQLPGVNSQFMRVGFDALVAALESSTGSDLTVSV